jgi:formylglycine-generating enzyme required for sulfatase activity
MHADINVSQWMRACTPNGTNVYPYAGAYDGGRCNGLDYGQGAPYEVQAPGGTPTTAPSCDGGAPGLWQMSGNVREWVNSCDGSTGASDNCRLRGGSYLDGENDLRCDADDSMPRDAVEPDIGFRCCFGG